MDDLHPLEPFTWAKLHFGTIKLGDERRNRRAITIAAGLARHPGRSIPKLFEQRYDVKAAYTFFSDANVTPQAVQAGHMTLVKDHWQQPGTYLLLEDTTEISWWRNDTINGLGPVGNFERDQAQGYLLHSTLAVRWTPPTAGQPQRAPVQVLGLAAQDVYLRRPAPPDETRKDDEKRRLRERETLLWPRATEQLGPAPTDPHVRLVRVADRGADIETFLRGLLQAGHGFVVRAAQNRRLLDPKAKARVRTGHVFDEVRAQPALGQFDLPLRGRAGMRARVAVLSVSAVRVQLWPTPRPDGRGKPRQAGVEVSVVRVFEAHPPVGVKGLEWVLLTDALVVTFEQAHEVALQYQARWLVEEFHKGLKSGLGADRLQLETGARLQAAVALMSVVAVRLLALREHVRVDPEADAAQSGLSELERLVLASVLKREFVSVRDVVLGLGRLGGHLGRKGDGLPGWQALWDGLLRLQGLVEGYQLAIKHRSGE